MNVQKFMEDQGRDNYLKDLGDSIVSTIGETNPLAFLPGTTIGLPASNIEISIVALEIIPIYQIMTATGYIANSSNISHSKIIAGISTQDILSNHSGSVLSAGIVTNSNWNWNTGDVLYLNGTEISKIPPDTGFIVEIGSAISSETILVSIKQSILL